MLRLLSTLLALLAVALCIISTSTAHPTADPLTVHLVCHSHDDVGWQITVDEYYDREVRSIINTVVASLAKNPTRKFMYVEQAFFQRWWREQNDTQRQLAQRLVADKQLEFVNGGWCMHDEAATHYVDMIDQTTLGHRYISQQFGVQPTTTWQIDPFGHSSTQAALFGQLSAIDGVFFARIDFQDKARRSAARELEMIWRASESLGSKAQVFAGAFAAGFGYGPPTGFCWDRGCRNPAIQNNKSLPGYNLDTFVDAFVATAQRQANETNGNNVMWTLGNDFEYTEAELWYANLDKLIDGVNADGRVKTLYSTPSIYLAAKNAEGISWPLKTDDFFPSYWTGYFTSRPALKRYVRQTSAFLQVSRHWEVFLYANGSQTQPLWEAQGVAQHHDGVSGTAKQAVTYDYAQRLSEGYAIASDFLTTAIGVAVSLGSSVPAFTTCPLLNVSICATSQSTNQLVVVLYNPSTQPRTQRISIPIDIGSDAGVIVTDSSAVVVPSQVQATMPNIARGSDSAGTEVQFVATLPPLGFTTYFITPTTITTATADVTTVSTPSALATAVKSISRAGTSVLARLAREVVAKAVAAPADQTISNDYWTLTFDGTTGFISSATDKSTGTATPISQQFLWYASYQGSGQDSGAYIFRPDQSNATAIPVTKAVTNFSIVTGAVVSEVRQVFGPWLTQIIRLTQGSPIVEFEYTVGHIPVDDNQGKEIISRFTTGIDSQSTFYTDSNGREFVKRVRNYRPTWNYTTTEVTAGNYYPVNALAWLADSNQGMAVLVDRSQGCSSLQDGALEFMVHRRLLKDDGRGVGEPLNEPGTDGEGLTITGTHYLILAPTKSLAAQARIAQAGVFAPAQPVIAPLTSTVADYMKSHAVNLTVLKTAMPVNLEIMTFQISELTSNYKQVVLLRLAHQFGVGEDPVLSQPVTVDIGTLLRISPTSVVELTLTANQLLGAHKNYQWNIKSDSDTAANTVTEPLYKPMVHVGDSYNVTIGPAEIRTFNITFGGSSGGKLFDQRKLNFFTSL